MNIGCDKNKDTQLRCDGQVQEVIQDGCSLIMDEEEYKSLMLTNAVEAKEIIVAGMESCVLTLLVVGGGGQDAGGVIDPKFGGAGSGS